MQKSHSLAIVSIVVKNERVQNIKILNRTLLIIKKSDKIP